MSLITIISLFKQIKNAKKLYSDNIRTLNECVVLVFQREPKDLAEAFNFEAAYFPFQ